MLCLVAPTQYLLSSVSLRGDDGPVPSLDGESQEQQLHRLANVAAFLGFSAGRDTGIIEGSSHSTSEDRARFLLSLVNVVVAAFVPDPAMAMPSDDDAINPGNDSVGRNDGRGEDGRGSASFLVLSAAMERQQEAEGRLLDGICCQHKAVFSTDCRLFPADVRLGSDTLAAAAAGMDAPYLDNDLRRSEDEITSLEKQCRELKEKLEAHRKSRGLAPRDATSSDGAVPSAAASRRQEAAAFQTACGQLAAQLAPLLETVRHFQAVFNTEIRPWTHKVDVPKLYGLGPAAMQLLAGYARFQKLIFHVRNIREALESLAGAVGTAGDGAGNPVSRVPGAGGMLPGTAAAGGTHHHHQQQQQQLMSIARSSEEALATLVDTIETLSSSCARERQYASASSAPTTTMMLGNMCAI
eukprot:jgi/Mesvir1/25178/Mv12873-RA.4